MAYPLDETASMALSDSDNADRVDPGHLPIGMRSFLGHVHTYQSASLKQNMDLAYYLSNQSVRSLFSSTKLTKDRFQTLVVTQANLPVQVGVFIC